MSYRNPGRRVVANPHHIEYSKSSKAKCHGPPPCKGSSITQGTLRYGRTVVNDFGETVQWMHWYVSCLLFVPWVSHYTMRIYSTGVALHRSSLETAFGIQRVPHFGDLRSEDQKKIRMVCAIRRVDPTDIPDSAKVQVTAPPTPLSSQGPPSSQPSSSSQPPSLSQLMPSSQMSIASAAPTPSQKKRKAAMEVAQDPSTSGSGLSSSHASGQRATPVGVRRLNLPVGTTWEEGVDDEVEIVEPTEELYCTMRTNVVGIQYYKGMVGAGENVDLVREPTNKYDRNAIQVKNIARVQVGHIPRDVASKLAPLMDRKLVTVEGVMQAGNQRGFHYSLAVTLKIFGPSDKRSTLEPLLVWATPGQRGFPQRTTASSSARSGGASQAMPSSSQGTGGEYGASGPYASQYSSSSPYSAASPYASSQPPRTQGLTPAQKAAQQEQIRKQQEAFAKAQELRTILNNLEKVDDEGRRNGLMDTLCSAEDVLALPIHANPPGINSGELTVDLLKHQKQALQWCIEHEYPTLPKKENDKPVQFWQYRNDGKAYYLNLATKTPQVTPPILGRGALCADSMGLGKTLTMLALILTTKKDNPPDYSKSTLIVVPLSIISNWEKQIQDHCKLGVLTYTVYYGSNRSLSPQDLQKFDVVITTYQTVSGEHVNAQGIANGHSTGAAKKKKKVESSLFGVHWKRVILDEGHNIRNPRTKMAQGVFALSAQRRWVLTGTPIINSPEDLGSILRFLKICSPLDNNDYYKRLVLRPLKDGDPAGAEILRGLMAQICIRRTKEMQDSQGNYLVPLPPVEMTLVPVTLTPEARSLYDVVEELSKAKIEGFMNAHGGLANVSVSTNALSMLTRLRQLALHPGLVPADYVEQLRKSEEDSDTTVEITPEERIRLQALLAQAIEDNEECPICFDVLNNPRITPCTHRFCMPCISEVIARDPKCPMDRRALGLGDLIEPPPVTELTQARARTDEGEDDAMDELRTGSSAKIDQLVHLLKLTPPTEKSLVFSQFTSFLDKIADTLEAEGISYVRFDGQMSARRRQEMLEAFCVPLTDTTATPTPSQASTIPARSQAPTSSQRSSRKRASTRVITTVEDAELPFQDEGDDQDFLPSNIVDDHDDDFLDEDDDGSVWNKKGKEKGKAKSKAKASRARFSTVARTMTYDSISSTGVNPKVLLISLKAGALGLNLTVANNVYLMDPWWQEGIESQAIDRCNRIGQTKPVHVYQLIAENTVESKVIDIQEKKKQLIKQAFSGIKSRETERPKKEARLQDLVQLFGIRLAASRNPAADNA